MNRAKLLGALVVMTASAQTGFASNWDISCGFFGSWKVRYAPSQHGGCFVEESLPRPQCGGITYMPHPGSAAISGYGPEVYSDATQCTFRRVEEENGALAAMIRQQSAPFPFNGDTDVVGAPNSVQDLLDSVPDLHFILMDIESSNFERIQDNITEIGRIVVDVNNRPEVRLGNYLWYPGEYEASAPDAHNADRTMEHAAYMNSELTVAIPSLYFYDNQGWRHVQSNCFSGAAPNLDSAMFWATLERLSTVARALPDGHLLIPFISPYVCKLPCEAPPPSIATLKAAIQHYRMRGVHGLVLNPGKWHGDVLVTDDQYEDIVYNAWHSLDQYFDNSSNVEFLNLNTVKTTGVEWSGILTDTHVVIITTNLGPDARPRIELPAIPGLPESVRAPFGHKVRVWQIQTMLTQSADFNDDGVVDSFDLFQLMAVYGQACINCPEDLDRDHVVDVDDLMLLLTQWGTVRNAL